MVRRRAGPPLQRAQSRVIATVANMLARRRGQRPHSRRRAIIVALKRAAEASHEHPERRSDARRGEQRGGGAAADDLAAMELHRRSYPAGVGEELDPEPATAFQGAIDV